MTQSELERDFEMKSTNKISAVGHEYDWLKTRRRILKVIKQRVQKHLGIESQELKRYRTSYENFLKKDFSVCELEELWTEVEQSQVVLGGDFHAFAQAQRTHLRILRDHFLDTDWVLALEALCIEDQNLIDQFMSDKISEEKFLAEINWQESWGFDWSHYRDLLELAKKRKYKVLALSPTKSSDQLKLTQRDEFAAKRVVEQLIKEPHKKIYMLFGDLHLAPQHIPKQLLKLTKSKLKYVCIHLNSEAAYFKLAEKNLDNEVQIIKHNSHNFVVLSSPPWVQWQSYLMFLENIHHLEGEDELESTDEVLLLVDMICQDLNLKISTNRLSVYTYNDELLLEHLESEVSARNFKLVRALWLAKKSLYFPQKSHAFLAQLSVNHLAELAGFYIHAQLSNTSEFYCKGLVDIEKQIWVQAMSFFLSKFVNHKRKSKTLNDLVEQLDDVELKSNQIEILKFVLDWRMSEIMEYYQKKKRRPQFKPRQRASYLFAARILGSMIGERLFIAFDTHKLSHDKILHILKKNLDQADFKDTYKKLVWQLEPMQIEIRSRKERL